MGMTITNEVLSGVGRRMRNGYLAGKVSEQDVWQSYKNNLKEVEKFSSYGRTLGELQEMCRWTHNPVLKVMIEKEIEDYKERSRKSNQQNRISLEKLENFREDALGIGLRNVIREMRRRVVDKEELEAYILLRLLELEFANLSAKKYKKEKERIYQRKVLLLEELSDLLREEGWKCGVSYETGKNASYIIYVYMPDGVQLSWHCNEYEILSYYDDIYCEWDGQACMTMEKILNYIAEHYSIGIKYKENTALQS